MAARIYNADIVTALYTKSNLIFLDIIVKMSTELLQDINFIFCSTSDSVDIQHSIGRVTQEYRMNFQINEQLIGKLITINFAHVTPADHTLPFLMQRPTLNKLFSKEITVPNVSDEPENTSVFSKEITDTLGADEQENTSVLPADIYSEIVKYLGFPEQLASKLADQFQNDHIKIAVLAEHNDFKRNHPDEILNFINFCKFGYLNLAKWLIKAGVDIHATVEYCNKPIITVAIDAFREACANGHIEIAIWLHQLAKIDIRLFGNSSFRSCCHTGHFEVAKWLYQLGADVNECDADEEYSDVFDECDDSPLDEIAFFAVCKKGGLELAKLMYKSYELGKRYDIQEDIDVLIEHSRKKGRHEVADWLHTL